MQHTRLRDQADALRDIVSLRLDDAERGAEIAINEIRSEMALSSEAIEMLDFGAGTRGSVLSSESKPTERSISEIYRRAAASPAWGRFMFRLVRSLKPHRVLELGTNLGVSAMHLAAALELNQEGGKLLTIEGDPTLSKISRENLTRVVAKDTATVLTGHFDEVLSTGYAHAAPFDLVFIDGHHEEAATLRYFERIRPLLAPGACVAFDDIEPFRPVRNAWKKIIAREQNSGTVDLLGIGLWFAPLTLPAQEARTKVRPVVQ